MSEITILHLSDIHWKKKIDEQNKIFRQKVQDELIHAVAAHAEKQGPPDCAAITGDIAFSGKKHEYDETWDFFEKFKKTLPGTVFLAVPGNHDLDRKKITKFISFNNIVKQGKTNEFLESPEDVENFINIKFSAFRDFCQCLQPGLYESGEEEPEAGEIKDNYFWVKNFEEKGVSFIGFNSAWASEGDQDRFQIALGYPQVYTALAKSTQPLRVVLMHHPPFGWLAERDEQRWHGEVFNKCGLILHGHVHVDSAKSFSTPSDSCISIGANATYTYDGYIGFQFIAVQFLENIVKVQVCPYKLEELDRIVFLPNTSRWVGQKGKPCFQLETQQPCAGDEDFRPLQVPLEYREWIVKFHSRMDIQQLDPNARAYNVPLPEVYILIETTNPFYKPEDEKFLKIRDKKEIIKDLEESDEPKEPQYIDIEELLGRQECILLRGPAGMGKTTLVKHLAYTITHGQAKASLCSYLPIVVFLKDLWPFYQKEFSLTGTNITFQSLLSTYLETRMPVLKFEIVDSFISRGRALFLLDGLDEVPEKLRRGLVEIIVRFRIENKNNRFLLTGRDHSSLYRFGKPGMEGQSQSNG